MHRLRKWDHTHGAVSADLLSLWKVSELFFFFKTIYTTAGVYFLLCLDNFFLSFLSMPSNDEGVILTMMEEGKNKTKKSPVGVLIWCRLADGRLEIYETDHITFSFRDETVKLKLEPDSELIYSRN